MTEHPHGIDTTKYRKEYKVDTSPESPVPTETPLGWAGRSNMIVGHLCHEIDRLNAILDEIHAAFIVPFQWSADTPEAVFAIMARAGYRMPNEGIADALEDHYDGDVPTGLWADWRPDYRRDQ